MRPTASPPWKTSELRVELLALYAEADALLEGWACACSEGEPRVARCCHFAMTGREPYPTAVELAEVQYAIRSGLAPRPRPSPTGPDRRKLPVASGDRSALGECPLLGEDGRCRIYASRPFGCRTFFCQDADGPSGPRSKAPRGAIQALSRRIADLSARFDPRDPQPRPFVRALGRLAVR